MSSYPVPSIPCMWIDREETWLGTFRAAPTPKYTATGGIGALLDRLDKRLAWPAGTVVLGGDLAADLGFTGDDAPGKGRDTTHPALDQARAHNWAVSKVRPWMSFRKVRHEGGREVTRYIHVGIWSWINERRCALYSPNVPELMAHMEDWYHLLGVPYFGEGPGVVGASLIRDHTSTSKTPRFTPDWEDVPPAKTSIEGPVHWIGPKRHRSKYEHGFDVNQQYLSAAGMTYLAVGELVHARGGEVLPKDNPAGYYRIRVPAWNYLDKISHPCGGAGGLETAWITGPTLDLCASLAEQGIMAEPEILERWTGAERIRILRGWTDRIRNALNAIPPGDDMLRDAVKGVYTDGLGMLHSRLSKRVYRPDWAAAVKATARVNLWRKVWAQGCAADRWPIEIAADTIWYASRQADPADDWPPMLPKGTGGGKFKLYGTRDRTHKQFRGIIPQSRKARA